MHLYILELEQNKFFIGEITSISKEELEIYFKEILYNCDDNNVKVWLEKYNPIDVLDSFEIMDKYDVDTYVYKYMYQYGIDNVRGGSFTETDLSTENIIIINHMIKKYGNEVCMICNENDHVAKNCFKLKFHQKQQKNNTIKDCFKFHQKQQINTNIHINTDTSLIYVNKMKLYNKKYEYYDTIIIPNYSLLTNLCVLNNCEYRTFMPYLGLSNIKILITELQYTNYDFSYLINLEKIFIKFDQDLSFFIKISSDSINNEKMKQGYPDTKFVTNNEKPLIKHNTIENNDGFAITSNIKYLTQRGKEKISVTKICNIKIHQMIVLEIIEKDQFDTFIKSIL
jgi:hypothetical protein